MLHNMRHTVKYIHDIDFLSLLLCLLFQLHPTSMKSQVYCNVRTFSMNDGLAANLFSSIAQTKDGLMWFGTWNGLSYFDGYSFNTYRDTPGKTEVLSSNRIFNMQPNSNGDLWCITYDRKLYLFDTRQCKYVSVGQILHARGESYKAMRDIYPLANGYSWIAGEKGYLVNMRINDNDIQEKEGIKLYKGFALYKAMLDKFNREWLFTNKGLKLFGVTDFPHFKACNMANLGDRTWFVSTDGKLASIGKNERRLRAENLGVKVTAIYDLCSYGKQQLLIGTDCGLIVYNIRSRKGSLVKLLHPMVMKQKVERIFTDSHRRIWMFTGSDGIVMLWPDGKTEWLQATADNLINRTKSEKPFFYQDEHGTVWTVPEGGTFSYYDEQTHKLVPYVLRTEGAEYSSLPLIKKFFIDNQHNLWFCGERDLTRVDFRLRRVHRTTVVLNQEVRSLCEDKNGNIWAGDHEGVIGVYDKNQKLIGYLNKSGQLQSTPQPFTTRVYTLFQDKEGRMWIGSKLDGLYCLNGGKIIHFLHEAKNKWSISSNDIYDIFQDKMGRIWIATYGGGLNIALEDGKGGMRFINRSNLLKNYPAGDFMDARRITETSSGIILVSTNGGLLTFSGKVSQPNSIHFYKSSYIHGDDTSLESSTVLQALVTRSGKIFVNVMGGGLQQVVSSNLLADNLHFKSLDVASSTEGMVQSMVEDHKGGIWLVRETTMDKFDDRSGRLYTFGINVIGNNVEFSEAKPLCSHNGTIYMACNSSFLYFDPLRMIKSAFVPNIVFTGVKFQGEDNIQSVLNTPELVVPSDKRSLTIYFSALDYSDNHLIRYAYRLKGGDGRWNYVGQEHSAAFNRLPNGHLKLEVRSTNADGVWQNNVRVLNIYAQPTFWESWMGWMMYILTGGAIIFIILYMFGQQQRIKMQAEMSDLRTTFFTNIGHKLRTPLTLIGGPVTEVMKNEHLSEKGHELLEMVRRNSENMLSMVNSMLSYNQNPDNYLIDDINAPFAETAEDDSLNSRNVSDQNSPEHPDIKLLVVEDNRDLRRFLFSILSSEYSVITAENGKDGLEKASKELPDFIISDVMMPEMDGLTMVHKLKENKNTSHIPIIILSAKASLQDKLQGLREGVDDYITKPFSATYLKERVANIISRRRSFQQDMLSEYSALADGKKKTEQQAQVENEASTSSQEENEQKNEQKAQQQQAEQYTLKTPEIIDEDKLMMEKLMAYLEENLDNSALRMEDLAAAVNLGRTVFYGKVKAIVGIPPNEFVRHIRLQRAEELVAKSKENFSQIAYAVGFSDPKYFSKCFKKETGLSPSEYREKSRQNKEK